MKKRKPANFNYDFTGLVVEVTGDDLYLINGGAEVENSHQGVANAQVGDTITRSNGQVVILNQGDIKYAQDQLGISGPATDAASPTPTPTTTPTPNVTMGGAGGASAAQATVGMSLSTIVPALSILDNKPRLTDAEIDKILERNQGVYANREELLEEWRDAQNWDSGIEAPFKSIDSAALYWAKTYGDDSIFSKNKELGSSIYAFDYENDDGSKQTFYFYNKPLQGRGIATDPDTGRKIKDGKIQRGAYSDSWNEYNVRLVSSIHSHANWDPRFDTENPSGKDKRGVKKDSEDYDSYTGKEFVVTPGGFLKEFNKDGITDIVSDNVIRDIRQDLSELKNMDGFTDNGACDFLFELYKNTFYHPDTFMTYSEYLELI